MIIQCEIDNIKTLKKGMKITLNIDDVNVKEVMKDIYNFMDMPITVDFEIDSKKKRERLDQISEDQRKKIYALINDISESTGNEVESLKTDLKAMFREKAQYDDFSLGTCNNELATDFIDFLINFAFEQGIPLKEHPMRYTDNLQNYLKACVRNKKCCICGLEAEVKEYENKEDKTKKQIALCKKHIEEARAKGIKDFTEYYHVEGVAN